MSHFYAEIQGGRGMATRCGHKNSGIYGHIKGWESGVKVVGEYNKELDQDVFHIFKTGGSSYNVTNEYIGYVINGEFKPIEK